MAGFVSSFCAMGMMFSGIEPLQLRLQLSRITSNGSPALHTIVKSNQCLNRLDGYLPILFVPDNETS